MNFDSYSQRRSIGGPKIELHQGPQQNYSKEDIEALIPEVIGKNDEELRRLKKSLIDSYYYKESSLIQQYIDLSKTDNTWKVVESFQEWLNQEIINALSNFEKNQEEITKESKEFEIRLRKEIESSLKQMMQRHIEELTNVEIMKSLEISREKNRVSQEVNDLWKQSKKLATKDDFEGAMKTKDLGDKMHAQQGERRREMVIEKYDKIIKQTFQKQRIEIDNLQKKLSQLLDEADVIHEKEQITQQKKVGVFLHYVLQKAVIDGSKQLTNKKMRAKLNRELTVYVEKILREKGKEELLSFKENQ